MKAFRKNKRAFTLIELLVVALLEIDRRFRAQAGIFVIAA